MTQKGVCMNYVTRLIDEYDKLSEKIDNLKKYIAKGDVENEKLLLSQIHYMQGYQTILKIRLRREGYDV